MGPNHDRPDGRPSRGGKSLPRKTRAHVQGAIVLSHAAKITHRFRTRTDVEKFWREVRNVGTRARRSKRDEERYCLGLFLLAISAGGLLRYPLVVTEREAPDFMLRVGDDKRTGLEVTRATSKEIQQQMTLAEKNCSEGTAIPLSQTGWGGDAAEREWIEYFKDAISKKLGKLDSYCRATRLQRYDLLIYDDTPLPSVERRLVIPELGAWIRNERERHPLLGKVSAIISLDVLYDVGGECRTLPFIESSPSDRQSDFGERIEHAAGVAIRRKLSENIAQ